MIESFAMSHCTAHIDVRCIVHNYAVLCGALPKDALGMPILKSDAYGHGLLPVAKALKHAPCFGVGTVSEALALRRAGMQQDILVLLGALNKEEMHMAAEYALTPLVYNEEALRLAAQATQGDSIGRKAVRIAIKCETGMGRLGFGIGDIAPVREFLRQQPHIDVRLALSHLACADMPEKVDVVYEQARLFAHMSAALQEDFPHMQRSLGNSAGSLGHQYIPDFPQEGCIFRFGIALYGGNPFHNTVWASKGAALQEAMRISAPILHTYYIKAGQSIGYGAAFVAPRDMRVAVLGVGYADGFARSLSRSSDVVCTEKGTKSIAHVRINGQAAPMCGRVCMGMLMVDISGLELVPVQDAGAVHRAWITYGNGEFSMQQLADTWGTILHEAQCLLGKNTREYELIDA